MATVRSLFAHFDSELRRSLKWQYFLNVGLGLLGALYIVGLSRLLGPASFGTYTLCAALPTVAVALLDCRLQEFVLYARENCEKSQFPSLLASLFCFDAASKLVAAGIALTTFMLLAARGYEGIYLEAVLLSTALVLASKCFSGPAMGILRSYGKLEYFSSAQVMDWMFRILALIFLAVLDRISIASVIISQILIGAFFNFAVIRRAMMEIGLSAGQLLTAPSGVPGLLRKYGKLIFANQGISAAEATVKELDVIVAGIFLTTAQIGIYKLAKSMAAVAWRLADPIFIVIMPKLAKLHSIGRTDELKLFIRALMLGLTPGAILLFGGSVLGVFLLGPYVFGAQYTEAVDLYPLAAIWILIALPLIWTHSISVASGRPGIQLTGSVLGNGIGLFSIWYGSWQWGIEGAMIGLSLAYCLPFVFSFILLRRLRIIS